MSRSADPLVSIITPALNSARFIERTIQSVIRQDYISMEHIIIDGGSSDGTLDILSEYPHLTWISEPDRGQSDALNKGFKIAKGKFIGWLNADDTYALGAVAAAASYLVNNSEVSLVYGNCNIIDEYDDIKYVQTAPAFDIRRELIAHNLPQPASFFRSDALKEVGFVDNSLHYIMDWDLYLRLGISHRIQNVDAVWANFRECSGTKTVSNPECFWIEAIKMFDVFFARKDLPSSVYEVKAQAYARANWMAGTLCLTIPSSQAQAAGRSYCNDAILLYPLLDHDVDFVLAQLTHCGVTMVGPQWAESYVRDVVTNLAPLSANAKKTLLDRALGHMFASLALMRRDIREVDLELWRRWLWQAPRNDPRWLRNGGVISLLVRDVLHRAIGD